MMVIANLAILAQDGYGENLQDLLWIIFVVVLSFLSGVGSWLRKKAGMKSEEEELAEVLGEEIIEAPDEKKAPRRPPSPQARPLRREPSVPAQAAARPARPKPISQQALSTAPATQAVSLDQPGQAPPGLSASLVTGEELPRWGAVRLIELDEARGASDRPIDIHAEVERHQLEEGPKAAMRGVAIGSLRVDDLRRAIVLKEVLGPPVSLRKPGEELWAPL